MNSRQPIATRDCSNLNSPLIEPGANEVIPGVVALAERQLCNDAAILSDAPLVVALPEQQWSYGVLLQLNQNAAATDDADIAIRLELSVRNGGAVGIAGLDAELAGLTTVEQIVGTGAPTAVTLRVDPRRTRAIVVRTASSGGPNPEVTLLDVSAYRAGRLQLAPRRHDLNYDLFVVLSMEKTATQTVEQTLLSLDPSVQVRRTHLISPESVEIARARARDPSAPDALRETLLSQAAFAENLMREIECVRSFGGRIALLSGMREPIARTVATIFQGIPEMIPGFALFEKASSKLADLFADYITDQLRRLLRQNPATALRGDYAPFFERDLGPLIGCDILKTPFDRDRGFTLAANGDATLLLYRFENVATTLAPALAALVGRRHVSLVNTNLSDDKSYASFYRRFQNAFKAPRDICSALYDDPYVRHFYSPAEIAAFKRKWQA